MFSHTARVLLDIHEYSGLDYPIFEISIGAHPLPFFHVLIKMIALSNHSMSVDVILQASSLL